MEKYTQTYSITNDNMDKDFFLKPTAALMYFQDCFARYLTTKNLAAFDVIKQNLFWIVSEYAIEFEKVLPFWSEQIKVEVWVSEITKLKIFMDFVIYHDEKPFAKGNSCWFILNTENKHPISTDIIKDNVPIINDFIIGEHKKFKLIETKEKINELSYTTNLSDIDFNHHVNNKSYINIAEGAYAQDFREKFALKKLHVKYNKETFLNDTLVCSTFSTQNPNEFVQKIEKDGISVCDIESVWAEKETSISIDKYNLKIRS